MPTIRNCKHCNKEFTSRYSEEYIKNSTKVNPTFCSRECRKNFVKSVNITCTECKKEFERLSSQLKNSKKFFCSKSCSATYYNKLYKDKKTKYTKIICPKCNKSLCKYGRKYCDECFDTTKNRFFDFDSEKLSDIIYRHLHPSSAFSIIRARARTIAKKLEWNSCKNCGYNKHIEVCHIKPISEFDSDSLVSEINSLENLIPLCPNCHWEFDNGILKL